MQQQLIEGLIVDHLETSGRQTKGGVTAATHVSYDACGRKVVSVAEVKNPSRQHGIQSPRRQKNTLLPSHAKRLMQSACADLQFPVPDSLPPAVSPRGSLRHVQTAPSPRSKYLASLSPRPNSGDIPLSNPAFPLIPQSPRRVLRSDPIVDQSQEIPYQAPLKEWGIPREHILEFIRLSVLPCTWAMNIKSIGNWIDADLVTDDQLAKNLKEKLQTINLPQIDDRKAYDTDNFMNHFKTRHKPLVTPARIQRSSMPREMSVDARINKILFELQQDPRAWDTFQERIKEYQVKKKLGADVDMVLENKNNAFLPPSPNLLEERKRQREEKHKITKKKHAAQLEMEHLHRIEQLDRRTQKVNEQRRRLAHESQVKMWLKAVSTVCMLENWLRRMRVEKKRKLLEINQVAAASRIQRVWRRKVHMSNSKAMLQIIIKTRQILWSLTFRLHCKNMAKAGGVLRRFLIDYFNGNSETGNFRVMMARWRWRVINAQRASKSFLSCNRARLHALSQLWDNADRERQRSEKQQLQHNKTIIVNNGSTLESLNENHGGSPRRLQRSTGIHEDSIVEMDQQLSAMQTMLTPIELQRMQQNAHHVVRIPKSIKMKLLIQYLGKRRAEHIQVMREYFAHVASNTQTRQVRVCDAREIVQNGAWGNLLGGQNGTSEKKSMLSYPVFTLYSKNTTEDIKNLVQEGVKKTLEQDPEQRRLVDSQRQGGVTTNGMSSSRRLSVFSMPGARPTRRENGTAKFF